MKDLLSAFGSELFRPLVTLVLPGAIGIGPFVVSALWAFCSIRQLADKNHLETAVLLVALSVFFGLLFEDIGAEIEAKLDGRANAKPPRTHYNDWYDYLCLPWQEELIGHRYIRATVLRLKFELGSSVACGAAILGVWFLPTTYLYRSILSVTLLVFAFFLAYEAVSSHALLAKVRSELLSRSIRKSAGGGSGTARPHAILDQE